MLRAKDEHSDEITAIPELLRVSDLKESIVTTDAMGTQKDIASRIIEKGGDYVPALICVGSVKVMLLRILLLSDISH